MEKKYIKILVLFASIWTSSCAQNDYVLAESISEQKGEKSGIIEPGDQIFIQIMNHENINTTTTVDDNGNIIIPLSGQIKVSQNTSKMATEKIKKNLSKFIKDPVVTLQIIQKKIKTVSIIGHIKNPGVYTLDPRDTILHIIAKSGGLSDFSGRSEIYIIRANQDHIKIRLKYDDLFKANKKSFTFKPNDGDIIQVK